MIFAFLQGFPSCRARGQEWRVFALLIARRCHRVGPVSEASSSRTPAKASPVDPYRRAGVNLENHATNPSSLLDSPFLRPCSSSSSPRTPKTSSLSAMVSSSRMRAASRSQALSPRTRSELPPTSSATALQRSRPPPSCNRRRSSSTRYCMSNAPVLLFHYLQG